MKAEFKKQTDLLIDALPYVFKDNRFALKGGSAINLFHRDLPRLSVDIDVCYLPLEDRETSLNNIHRILSSIKISLEYAGYTVRPSHPFDGMAEAKLYVSNDGYQIKIEPNYVLRGSLHPPEIKTISKEVVNEFGKEVEITCLSLYDLFGGKICAALDRQHPRDLFDIKILLENEGLTEEIKDSFIFYLLSHNRPPDELLSPIHKNLQFKFENEFTGMARLDVSVQDLENTRSLLVKKIIETLTENDKKFLLSFFSRKPDWTLFPYNDIENYPAVKWKIVNLGNLNDRKLSDSIKRLEKALDL